MNKNTYIIGAVLLAIVGSGAFYGGMKYQQGKSRQVLGQFAGRNGAARNGNQGFRPVNGEILSMDDKSITVKLNDGSSKIVLLTDATTISKSDTASKSDLKVGDKVAAFGTANSDGSITAQNVQLNPVLRNAGGQP